MITIRIACAAMALSACAGGHQKHQLTASEMIAADPLPLKKGAKWTYEVTIKRFDLETDRETVKTMPWTIEVVDAREANGITAYRVKGWPSDQSDFQTAGATVEKTLLRRGNSFLFGGSPEPTLEGAAGWFSWPVIDGQRICPSAENVYCWQVSATEGGYALALFAGPDEQRFDLEPGTGVSRFHFRHHGPTDEVDAKLVSYSSGK